MSETILQPLVRLGQHLIEQEAEVTSRWLAAVTLDRDITRSDALTRSQLIDHLPAIYAEVCDLLMAQDLASSEPEIRRDAKTHGHYRWKQGYQLDEMVRELDVLRGVLVTFVTAFAERNVDFRGAAEAAARQLIDELFSIVTMNSIRQAVAQQRDEIDAYTSELEQRNRELMLQQVRLQQLEESRLQLTRSVAHDLRNFLQVFATSLQVMRRQPARAVPALDLAERQTRDMNQLVDQLVSYSVFLSKGEAPVLESFELTELFAELADAYRPIVEQKGLRFDCRLEPALGNAVGDSVRIKQIAFNLLSNAVKYTQQGSISFSFDTPDQQHWSMRVGDTGQGIEQVDQQRVFEEFERGAKTGDAPGVGLGLAIVKELVADLGGTIGFSSLPGTGSMFEVVLPRNGNRNT